jgi:microcin C transport system substrate-binding protein
LNGPPLFVVGLPIFSRAYYTAHNFDETSLETPLGSGPYKVGGFEAGRYIEYQRVADWWGATLPVSVGQNNFDTLRYEYYRDREVGFEGFTAKNYLFREEFTSRTWATRYDNVPAVRDGRVKRDEIPDDTPSGAQGWFINLRRPKFANPQLRLALYYAFDFEWTNKTHSRVGESQGAIVVTLILGVAAWGPGRRHRANYWLSRSAATAF